ncbi:phage portal protein [Agrobacterium tumefaciens]|uniref:Phage portal protein n=1 Tax=Agrobacterium tumefaciens TaxID=358 RepID=A0AA44F6F7_AGRTU|nr:phage portal protein [Agrobacterium tumefaciens]NTB86395.1 phage portal protein [Agrobacterium tumefaciens]NTC17411.1 phage portal protein [Agrobacterium tumefaciens]NTC30272.1 phage portal protein [Agrobacterium tumefaciens]
MNIWPFSRTEKIETRDANVADDDGVLHALWSGMTSGSVAVSGSAALRVPAVASCVRVISEAAASLPVRIMERGEDGSETEDLDHPIGVMLRGDVNPWTSGFDLIRDMTADALTRDWGGLAFVNRVGDEVREVIRYQPSMISVDYDSKTGEPRYRIEGMSRRASEILHVRGPFDKSPLTLAAEAIGVSRVMEQHASALFKNGARPGGVIQSPKALGDAGVKSMIKAWRAAHDGADKTGKTAILWDGATFQQMMLNSVDSQFLELRKFQILEICRAFRVPPSMVFELDRSTWSNGEQQGREFLTYTLEPWLQILERTLSRALLSREERQRYRILLDRDDLTRADLTARATAISSLISAKVLNPNEARSWLDLGRYDGGDDFANPHINPTAATSPAGGSLAPTDEPVTEKEPTNDA